MTGRTDIDWPVVLDICISPVLNIGVTFALLRSSGYVPVSMLRYRIFARGSEMTEADLFRLIFS